MSVYDDAQIHPMFHPSRFPADIDYERAIYEPALLATRLMHTPQAFQHDHCFYFGLSMPTEKPDALVDTYKPEHLPAEYACDKAIGELNAGDISRIQRVRLMLAEHVRFKIGGLEEDVHGETEAGTAGLIPLFPYGYKSIITLSSSLYDAVLGRHPCEKDANIAKLHVAIILLHELGHAAHNMLFGPYKCEDFRETSNVAEAGFEYISRIFGANLEFELDYPDPAERVYWQSWQSHEKLEGASCYDLKRIARRTWEIPDSMNVVGIDPNFVMKLFDEGFWTGEYLERGAVALIPKHIADICRSKYPKLSVYRSIPLSVRDLFREKGPSYAKSRYGEFANPECRLRDLADHEEGCGSPFEDASTTRTMI